MSHRAYAYRILLRLWLDGEPSSRLHRSRSLRPSSLAPNPTDLVFSGHTLACMPVHRPFLCFDLMFTFIECARRQPTQPDGVSQGRTPPRPGRISKIIRVVHCDRNRAEPARQCACPRQPQRRSYPQSTRRKTAPEEPHLSVL